MKPKWKDFGKLLKEIRRSHNISRAELASEVMKKESTIASWEQGYRRPKLQSILNISNIFGVPIQQLQTAAGYTPEFNWYLSLTAQPDTERDFLLDASEDEKKELRSHLLYLRFKLQIESITPSSS
jgi:transcriptional regulator with XRE-family HTH domain